MLTLALTKSMLTVDWSTGSVGSASQWVPLVSLTSDTYKRGPCVRLNQSRTNWADRAVAAQTFFLLLFSFSLLLSSLADGAGPPVSVSSLPSSSPLLPPTANMSAGLRWRRRSGCGSSAWRGRGGEVVARSVVRARQGSGLEGDDGSVGIPGGASRRQGNGRAGTTGAN